MRKVDEADLFKVDFIPNARKVSNEFLRKYTLCYLE